MARAFGRRASAVGLVAIVVVMMAQPAWAVLNVSPDSNLPTPASINVSGTGFSPNQPGTLRECKLVGAVDECKDLSPFMTDSAGNFGPTPVQVTRTYTSSNLVFVDCNAPPNPCRVVADLNNLAQSQEAPISFAGYPLAVPDAVPAPDSVLPVDSGRGAGLPVAAGLAVAGVVLLQLALVGRLRARRAG